MKAKNPFPKGTTEYKFYNFFKKEAERTKKELLKSKYWETLKKYYGI